MLIDILVFSSDGCYNEWPPEKADDFLAWFAGKIEQIPSEYRESATVKIDTIGYVDDQGIEIKISYTRPETDLDVENRKLKEKRQRESVEYRELREFERLKKKFGEG